ncbi:hypothetical protein HD806DRAFT_515499 [Xylariaceae sp. AK1471]|nr:hypothetical protein HD806DRAFT_515499 [Xylariaceae sp. AK1471]
MIERESIAEERMSVDSKGVVIRSATIGEIAIKNCAAFTVLSVGQKYLVKIVGLLNLSVGVYGSPNAVYCCVRTIWYAQVEDGMRWYEAMAERTHAVSPERQRQVPSTALTNHNILIGLVVRIPACHHTTDRRWPGFDSPIGSI